MKDTDRAHRVGFVTCEADRRAVGVDMGLDRPATAAEIRRWAETLLDVALEDLRSAEEEPQDG